MADKMAELMTALEGMSDDGLRLVSEFVQFLAKIQAKEGATEAQQIWESALGELKTRLTKSDYQTWLEKTVGLSYQANQLVVGVPNEFVAQYLDKTQRALIKEVLTLTHLALGIKVVFTSK